MPAIAGEVWDVQFFGGIFHGEHQSVEFGATELTVHIGLGQDIEWESEYEIVENHLPRPDDSTRHVVCAVWKGPITREHLEEYRHYLHLQMNNA